MKKLIIADYIIRNLAGHSYNYAMAVAEEAKRNGIKVEVWWPSVFGAKTPRYFRPVLKPMVPFSRLNFIREIWDRAMEFRVLLKDAMLEKDTGILFQTVSTAFPLSLSLALLGRKPRAKIVVVLRRGLADRYVTKLWSQSLQRAVGLLLNVPPIIYLSARKGVVFASDSPLITKELASLGVKNAITLPIPHLPKENGRKVRGNAIGYIGSARHEKGFDFMPRLVEKTLEADPSATFIVQNYVESDFFGNKEIFTAQQELQGIAKRMGGRLRLIAGQIPKKDYCRVMNSCSHIVLPYRRELYGKGTTGILCEAIALGKWVIAPDSSWIRLQQKGYRKLVLFREETPEAMADALQRSFAMERGIDRREVRAEIRKFREFHSARNYLRILDGA